MENRINTVDFIRGISVILMVIGHVYYAWPIQYKKNMVFVNVILFIVLFAPPFFLIISGLSFSLFIFKNIKSSKKSLLKETCLRAFFIFIVSTLFQLLFGFILEIHILFIIYWSIFQVIAFSMLLFVIILFLKRILRFFLYFIILFSILFFYCEVLYYKIRLDYFILTQGAFPFIPWVSFFIIGLIIGDLLINNPKINLLKLLTIFLAIGITILTIWLFTLDSILNSFLFNFFKALSVFLILFSILDYYIDVKEIKSYFSRRIIEWGKVSFSIYYIQFGIIICLLIMFNIGFIRISNENSFILIILISFLMVLNLIEIFLIYWKRYNYKFGIEYFMNIFSKKTLFIQKEIKTN